MIADLGSVVDVLLSDIWRVADDGIEPTEWVLDVSSHPLFASSASLRSTEPLRVGGDIEEVAHLNVDVLGV